MINTFSIIFSLFLLHISITNHSFALKRKYDEWLKKEVKLIITAEEKRQFELLKTDEEREKFIQYFWAKRDPYPSTEENEFKIEWYKRLEFVTKHFCCGPEQGINSARGRVFMLLGPPAQIKETLEEKRERSPEGEQKTSLSQTPTHPFPTLVGKYLPQEILSEKVSQIWVYQPFPELGIRESFSVIFRKDQFGYVLDENNSPEVLNALETFSKVTIFNPNPEEIKEYQFSLDKNSLERKLWENFLSKGIEFHQIYLKWSPFFTRARDGSSFVSFLIEIDLKKSNLKDGEEFIFFGWMENEREEREEIFKALKTEKEGQHKVIAQLGFPLSPGNYTLYFGLRNKKNEKHALLKSNLDVPDFSRGELDISSVVMSPQVISIPNLKVEEDFEHYLFGHYKIIPRLDNVFSRRENLNVLFQIYNYQIIDDEVFLRIEYFIIASERIYRLKAQEIKRKIKEEKAILSGTEFPLSPLKSGKYIFLIKIHDKNSNKTLEKKVAFTIK